MIVGLWFVSALAGSSAGSPCEAEYRVADATVRLPGTVHRVCLHYRDGDSVVADHPPRTWTVRAESDRIGPWDAPAVPLDDAGCASVCVDPGQTWRFWVARDPRVTSELVPGDRQARNGVTRLFVARPTPEAVRTSSTATVTVIR